jgi:hypothetical protein
MCRTILLTAILLWGAAALVFSQPQPQESLGDVARQNRAQKDATKRPRVFTNDNLPGPAPGEPVTTLSSPPEKPSRPVQTTSTPATPPSSKETGNKRPESAGDRVKTRDYWQGKFKAARQDVAKAREHQTLAEDELNLLQIQQVREIDSAVKADLTTKVQAKQSEVDVDKAAGEAALKALDNLEKDFQESGAPDDWSKTEEASIVG